MRKRVIAAARELVVREFDNGILINGLAQVFRNDGLGSRSEINDGI
jgi:hypothetical protein